MDYIKLIAKGINDGTLSKEVENKARTLISFYNKTSKGDFIKFVSENDTSIKAIDSAVPQNVHNELSSLGIDCSFMATAYYVDGSVKIINVLEYSLILALKN